MDSRQEILHLMNQYGFSIDTGDLDGCATLFSDGEWCMDGADPCIGKDAFRNVLSNVIIYDDGTPRTKHVTASVDLEIDEDADAATSQCYVTVYQQTSEFPLQVIFSGHYFDEFERANGAWRFRKRHIKHQLVGDMSAHLKTIGAVIPNQ